MKKRKTKKADNFDTSLKKLMPEFKELIDFCNNKFIYHIGGRETLASKN
jgi:hypothetical protein